MVRLMRLIREERREERFGCTWYSQMPRSHPRAMSALRVWCVGCLILHCRLPASIYHAELIELPTRLQAKSLRSRDAVHPATIEEKEIILLNILYIFGLNTNLLFKSIFYKANLYESFNKRVIYIRADNNSLILKVIK
jgi:hypothetical protein